MLDHKLGLIVAWVALALSACGGGGGDGASAVDSTLRLASDTTTKPVDSASGTSAPEPVIIPAKLTSTSPTSPSTGQVSLRWAASPEADTQGYRVYYGTSSRSYRQAAGAGIGVGASTSAQVEGLTPGQTYYFAVTAYDKAGNESNFSAEVAKLVQ